MCVKVCVDVTKYNTITNLYVTSWSDFQWNFWNFSCSILYRRVLRVNTHFTNLNVNRVVTVVIQINGNLIVRRWSVLCIIGHLRLPKPWYRWYRNIEFKHTHISLKILKGLLNDEKWDETFFFFFTLLNNYSNKVNK